MGTNVQSALLFVVALSLAGYTGFTRSGPQQEERARLTVYNDSILSANFLGVNAVYHGFAFMEDADIRPLNETERTIEFARVADMDLKIARTWYRPDWACGNNLYNDFNWESARMKAFYQWLDQMKALKVDVALQAGWWFTKDTYHNTTIPPEKARPNPEKDPERFAEWVDASLHQLIKVRGYTNIKYLMLFTEPLNYKSGNLPDGISAKDYYAKICRQMHLKLKTSGLRSAVKLVGPNSGSTDTAAYVGWSAGQLNDVIDIYSWHSYNGRQSHTNPPMEYAGWKQIAAVGAQKIRTTGKPFWIDEYGASKPTEAVRFQPDYGNYLAQCVAAFVDAGAQTSLLWILFDQKYPASRTTNRDSFYQGIHRWGLIRSPQDSAHRGTEPYPAWHAFRLMSKYLGGRTGTNTLKTRAADSLYVVATTPDAKELSVMVVNASHKPRSFSLDFSKKTRQVLYRHLYDPANIPAGDGQTGPAPKMPKTSQFKDALPARAVAIYTTIKN